MRILISSHFFFPQLGGIEVVGRLLAEEFVSAGHEVKVVTTTEQSGSVKFPFEVLCKPRAAQLFAAVKWCDVYFHNNVSVQTAWPLVWFRRPWVITHQTWIPRFGEEGMRGGLAGQFKRALLRWGHSVSISRAVADDIGVPSTIIPNPYRDDVFRVIPEIPRDRDLVFVGRLVSDKGVDVLIRALAQLRVYAINPSLTIIGSGPEESSLRALARHEGVEDQIVFAGPHSGIELARLLNAHRIMVIPSRWAEPFGIVALEGIACGCVPIGSQKGGLADAMGPCGLTFPNGDVASLAEQIVRLLKDSALQVGLLENAEQHLSRHCRGAVASAYLALMARLLV